MEQTSVTDIRINNCNHVTISTEAIKYLSNLRFFTINNVKDLKLQYRSLNWCGARECTSEFLGYFTEHPSVDITINNTTISEIEGHVFSERIREVNLNKVTINKLRAFSFTNLKGAKKIVIRDSTLNGIEAQAFKKFSVDYLFVMNTKIDYVPSRTFSEIEVLESFRVLNSNFDTIKPMAFIVKQPKSVEVMNSKFNELEGESFKVTTNGRVTIKNNFFNIIHPLAFMGFSSIRESRLTIPELLFSNNTFNELKKDTLAFNRTSFMPKVGTIFLNQTCACADIRIWQSNSGYHEDIHCLIKTGRAAVMINAKAFSRNNCEDVSSSWVVLVAVIIAVVLFLIITSVVLFFIYKRYRIHKEKEYMNRGRNKNGSLGLIVPDGRTYRETELHVIVEKAELLTTEL